jgi:uncharacterized protein YkwD
VLGAVVVTAGAGVTWAALDGEDRGRSDRVAGSTTGDTSAAEDAVARTAPPAPSPTAAPSDTVSASPTRSAKPKRTTASTRTATPTAEPTPEPATTSATAPRPAEDVAAPAAGPEAEVLALVNEERAVAGCAPLTADDRLTRAADDYSDVMAGSGVMSHTGPDGSTMASRVEAAGYPWSALGENIARGQADAASVMGSWMNSPGHRANILNCSFTHLGVGVHFGDGGPWWTQDFGTGR